MFLIVSLLVESSFANTVQSEPDYIFKIESQPSDFTLTFKDSEPAQPSSNFIFNFPTSLKANNNLSVINSFKDTRYVLSQDTELSTLIARNDDQRLHTKLESGQLILDARQTSQSIQTIQVGNVFLKPFTNGIYYLSKSENNTTIGSIQGSFVLGVYGSNGSLQSTLLIHRYQEVNFGSFLDPNSVEVSSLSSNNFTDDFRFSQFYNIDQSVLEGELFTLTFKGKTLKATNSNPIQASLSPLNFNQRKENFLIVYPFYKKLEDAKQLIKANNTENLSQTLAEARQIYSAAITEDPTGQSLFRETANMNLQLISGLNPLSKYNSLKIFLADTFSNSLDSVTALKLSLSLLEDINYGYDNSKPDISVRSEQVLLKVISSSGLKEIQTSDKINLVVVMDNIIDTYPQSLTSTLFRAREQVVQEIMSETDDQDLINQFEARKITFIQEVINRAQSGDIEIEKAKNISFTIIETLPEDLQDTYRLQLNEIDQ